YRPRSQEHGHRPSLRSRPRARQQSQGERQDTTQNRQLEPGFPATNPSTQMSVNLDSVPCACSATPNHATEKSARVPMRWSHLRAPAVVYLPLWAQGYRIWRAANLESLPLWGRSTVFASLCEDKTG